MTTAVNERSDMELSRKHPFTIPTNTETSEEFALFRSYLQPVKSCYLISPKHFNVANPAHHLNTSMEITVLRDQCQHSSSPSFTVRSLPWDGSDTFTELFTGCPCRTPRDAQYRQATTIYLDLYREPCPIPGCPRNRQSLVTTWTPHRRPRVFGMLACPHVLARYE